jgi:hypothetical protein
MKSRVANDMAACVVTVYREVSIKSSEVTLDDEGTREALAKAMDGKQSVSAGIAIKM